MGGHWIKQLQKGAHGLHALFFDCETHTKEVIDNIKYQEFTLATACTMNYRSLKQVYISEIEFFNSKAALHDYVDKCLLRNGKIWIISANIWFDIRVSDLLLHLVTIGFNIDTCHVNNMCFIMGLSQGDIKIMFCNLQQFVPMSVKAIGELIGLPKLDIDIQTKNIEELTIYCKRDTEIITTMFKHYMDFIHTNELGKIGFTLAGQALNTWRYKYIKKGIYSHQNMFISNIESKAYYGGRVEIRRYGKVPCNKIYKLDINSMYPHIMQTIECPYQWYDTINKPKFITIPYYLHRYNCLGQVAIDTDKPIYPLKKDGKLIFPIGRFTTWLSDAELRYGYENGHIVAINYLVTYKKAILFADFVSELYKLRLKCKTENNEIFVYLCKRLLNSLYGKFAQRIDNVVLEELLDTIEWEVISLYDSIKGKRYTEQRLGRNRRVLEERVKDGWYTLTAISAQITSAARLYLWQLMDKAGYKNVFYCDTDSIYCNEIGYNNLKDDIDNNKLGKLKLEGMVTNLKLWGAKDYDCDGVTVIKGIRKNAEVLADNTFRQVYFPGFKGDMRRGLDKAYGIHSVDKYLSREYKKGIISPSGDVSPLLLAEF